MTRGAILLTACLLGCGADGEATGETEADSTGSGSAEGITLQTYTASTSGAQPGMQSDACEQYMRCIADVDPASVAPAGERYGAMGSCWFSDVDAAQCTSECIEGIERLCGDDPGRGSATAGDSGPPPCSLSALAPAAESWLVAGDAAQELPVEIGEALERNCGCHLADLDAFDPNVPLYYGALRISTWADFQANFGGQPAYVEVHARAIESLSMPPIYFCEDEAFGSLTAEDFALLDAWLTAGAPDAPTWASDRGDGTTTG